MMKTPHYYKLLFTYLFSLVFTAPAAAQFIIDDFLDEHATPAMSSNFSSDSAILGGEREVDNTNNSFSTSNINSELLATLDFFNSVRVVYDGDDNNTAELDYNGLGGLDLASTSDALLINRIQTLQFPVTIDVAVYTSEGNSSFARRELPSLLEPVDLIIPFVEFEVFEGDGADFSNVGAIEFVITGNGETLFYVNSFGLSDTPLPVELTSFTALQDQDTVTLEWETASELNNAGFVLEHQSPQSALFQEKAFIEGQGTTDKAQTYRYTISGLANGVHQFRLKQVDFDGAFEYSPVVDVELQLSAPYLLSEAYPNPFNPQAIFSLAVSRDQQVTITLHDMLGRQVDGIYAGLIEAEHERQFVINATGLASGTYFYLVNGEFFRATGQVFVQK